MKARCKLMKVKELFEHTKTVENIYKAEEVIGHIALDKEFDEVNFVVVGQGENSYTLAKLQDEHGVKLPYNIITLRSDEPVADVSIGSTISGIAIRDMYREVEFTTTNELVVFV